MAKSILSLTLAGIVALGSAPPMMAQATGEIDCDDPANQEADQCLGLPVGSLPITNFVPLIAPLVIAGAVAAAGAGSSSSTPNTTSGN